MKKDEPDDVVQGNDLARTVLPTLFGGAIIVAALYYGQELAVPLVLAALLAFVLKPLCTFLERRLWLPRALAVLVAVLLTFAILGALGTIVGRQAATLAASLPTYQSTITTKWEAMAAKLGAVEHFTKDIGKVAGAKPAPAAKPGAAGGIGLPADMSGMTLFRSVALPILGPLGTFGVTLIFAFFILLSNEDLRDRLVRLVGRNDLHRTILAMNDAASRLSRFFLFQLGINAAFGAVIGVALWIAGMPSPLLWGILAGVMRFVPFLGVIVAAVPPILLAVAIVPGWTLAIVVLAVFVVAESLMGQVVEPLIYGHNTGLSPIAVIVATAFWALIWGPIGLLIATPLTVCLVVLGRHVEALSFLDVILGDAPPLEPPETFYQRALEGRGMALAPDARKRIAAASYADYCDRVALPGLALAQGDLARDDSAFERLDAIHGQIGALMVRIRVDARRDAAKKAAATKGGDDLLDGGRQLPRVEWRNHESIVCVPGRGQLDDLAALMAVHALRDAGFGAYGEANLVLNARDVMPPRLAKAKLCCLSVIEEGSTAASIRYFIRRVQKQMPGVTVVVGLWHAERDSSLLSTLRAGGGEEHVVLSISELIAFCQTLGARQPAPAAEQVEAAQ